MEQAISIYPESPYLSGRWRIWGAENAGAGLRSGRPCCRKEPGTWCPAFARSIGDDCADRLALVHEVKALIDAVKRQGVGDHRVDLDLPIHVPVDDLRHIRPPARAAKCRAFPDTAGDKLEWARRDLGPGGCHADDDRLAPAAMAGFERRAHDLHIAGAVKGVIGAPDLIGAALRHVDEMGNQIVADLPGVHEMGHAEAL